MPRIIGKTPFEKAEDWTCTVKCPSCETKNLVDVYDFQSYKLYEGGTGMASSKCAFCNETIMTYIEDKAVLYVIKDYLDEPKSKIDLHLFIGRLFVLITYPLFTYILITLSSVITSTGLFVFILIFTLWINKSHDMFKPLKKS